MTGEMRETTFWILTALALGRRHGYALLQEIEEQSEERVRLRVTTLYAALERLESEGLISPAGDERINGRVRRYFRLTEAGRAALGAEVTRMEASARRARTNLGLRPATAI
ncbi:PadR family transcriptional regulator [Rathayibacter sp. AY1E9]|uniref:PadR family transcriptional regulator n=1 Tax=unclassified Rathayibacter TaxID=2609250 RepID=UPI000CE7BEE1|nr:MULTISPECIES: helix-turn-helix transcriptional regulator [unclassified Rathayibacter]PPG50963.1 PadR family transcriptional regulator [Rathayibacter sp. AY1E9]PPG55871.1 PadR family transcriptional regulator [Rathayibacter sp. AY1C5]PPH39628.1 PadR family transcriptional regulator [Rathayibacter sp. AY1E4]